MRHRVADKKFNRTSNARKALFTGLLRNLTEHGEIVTTLSKAKAVKGLADRMVAQAKNNTIAGRRLLHRRFGKRDVVSTLVERVAPAMMDRQSGYVTITAIGPRRGDNTAMARLAFVNKTEGHSLKRPASAEKTAAAAKRAPKVAPVKAIKAVKDAAKKSVASIKEATQSEIVKKKSVKKAAK